MAEIKLSEVNEEDVYETGVWVFQIKKYYPTIKGLSPEDVHAVCEQLLADDIGVGIGH